GRGRERGLHALVVALVDNLDRLANLQKLPGVSVGGPLSDRLPGALYDDVPFLQPRLFRGSSADDTTQQEALYLRRVVGNRSREDSYARPATADRGLIDFHKLWRLVHVHELLRDSRREADDAIQVLVVDLVFGIGRRVG